jgi:hypothetical protein
MTNDDVLGDPIPSNQLRPMQEVCYQLLKMGKGVGICRILLISIYLSST